MAEHRQFVTVLDVALVFILFYVRIVLNVLLNMTLSVQI